MISSVKTRLTGLLAKTNGITKVQHKNLSNAFDDLIMGYNATDCFGGVHIINKGVATLTSSYTAALTPDDGYVLEDDSVKVLMDGVDITSTSYKNGAVTVNSLTGDLKITASARTLEVYTISNVLTYCSNSNAASTIYEGQQYVATITPDEGYELKAISVFMSGQDITNSVYTDGVINISNVSGTIEITAICGEITTYAADYSLIGTSLSNQPKNVSRGSVFETTVTPSSVFWGLYDGGITVTMNGEDITSDVCVFDDSYQSATITIPNVLGDISIITSVCQLSKYRKTFLNYLASVNSNGNKVSANSRNGNSVTGYTVGNTASQISSALGGIYMIPIPTEATIISFEIVSDPNGYINNVILSDLGASCTAYKLAEMIEKSDTEIYCDISDNSWGYMVVNIAGYTSISSVIENIRFL